MGVVKGLMALNKCGIRIHITQKAGFVLISRQEADGTFSFVLVDEMLGYKGLPGGRPEKGENREAAAKREAWEETGCRVKTLGILVKEGEEIIFSGAIKLNYSVYEAEIEKGELNSKLQGAKYCSQKDIERFIQDGTLLGSYVWIAILHYYAKENGTVGMSA